MEWFFAALIWGFIALVPLVILLAVFTGWRAGTRGMSAFLRWTDHR